MTKVSKPTIAMVVLLAVVSVWFFGTSDNSAKSRSISSKWKKPVKKISQDEFTEEDYKAKFASLSTPVKNVFAPLVVRSKGFRGSLGAMDTGPMIVPPELTMGQASWVYTGMAEVDNVPMALVENTETQEGVFLKRGEKWKLATVFSIGEDELVLSGPDGVRHTVKVGGIKSASPTAQTAPSVAAGFQPLRVNPNLSGPIGGPNLAGIQVQPADDGSRRRSGRFTDVQSIN